MNRMVALRTSAACVFAAALSMLSLRPEVALAAQGGGEASLEIGRAHV